MALPANPIAAQILGKTPGVSGALPPNPLKGLTSPGVTPVPTPAPAPAPPTHTLAPGGLEQLNQQTEAASQAGLEQYNRAAGTSFTDPLTHVPIFNPQDKRLVDSPQYQPTEEAFGSMVNPIAWGESAVLGAKQLGHGLATEYRASGDALHGKFGEALSKYGHGAADVGLGGLGLAAVLPLGRGARALGEVLGADRAVTAALRGGNFQAVRDIAHATAPSYEEALAAAHAAFKAMPQEVFRQIGVTPEEFARHLVQGASMRYWYEESAHGILQMAGGNKNLADKYAQVTAIMSAQKEPLPNIQLANRAIHEFQTYGRVLSGDEHQAAKATAVLRGQKWDGVKTDRFYKNMLEEINPAKYRRLFGKNEVTNDIWMARLYGLKSDVPTPREYAAMTKATQAAGDQLGWKAKQVQAAQWISKKAESEPRAPAGGASTFADALQLEHARIPFEAAPGREAAPELHAAYQSLTPAQQEAYTSAKARLVQQYLREADVMGRMGGKGPGVYEGEVNPGRSVDIAASRSRDPHKEEDIQAAPPEKRAAMREENRLAALVVHPETRAALNREAATIGHALNQDAAVWHKPFFVKVAKKRANGMRLELGNTISKDQAVALDGALREAGHGGIAVVHHPNGADILKTPESPLSNPEFHKAVAQAADKAGISGTVVPFAWDGNYIDRSAYASHMERTLGRGSEGDGGRGADLQLHEGRRADALRRLVEGSAAVDRQHLGGLRGRLADESGQLDLGAFHREHARSQEEAHSILLEAAAKAKAEGFTRTPGGRGHPPLVEKGVATEATGGELGQRVREAMLKAPAVRKVQKEAQSGERSDRVRAAARARLEAGGGSAGQAAAKHQLSGEYGQEFFQHLKDIQPHELEQLKKMVDKAPLQEFEKVHAIDALDAAVQRGVVPQPHDQALLERVFGRVASAAPADEAQGFWQKFSSKLASALNIPRALRAATDLGSAGFRQSLVTLVTHPAIFWRNWVKTFPAVVSPKFYEAWMQKTVYDRPTYPLMLKYGVPFTEHGTTLKSVPIGRTEEPYIGENAAQHLNLREVPGLHGLGRLGTGPGDLVSATGRGFVGFQNAVRAELFDQLAHVAVMTGRDSLDEVIPSRFGERLSLGQSIARVAGTFTGRGVMPKAVERRFITITSTMFSPRLMASRLNMLSPVYYYKLDPFARAEAVKGARNLVVAVGTMMYVAKLLGGTVNFDPRSSNFGKVKVGNTRVDLTGGFNQYIRLLAQEMTRQEISSSGHRAHIGWGQHDISDLTNVTKLVRSKQAPVTGTLWDELSGKDFVGQPVKQSTELRQLGVPFAIDDALRAEKLGGPAAAIGAAFLSAIGLSVQTYKDKPPAGTTTPGGGYGSGGGGYGGGGGAGGYGGTSGGYGG